jgi:hypothetical protein
LPRANACEPSRRAYSFSPDPIRLYPSEALQAVWISNEDSCREPL